MRGAAPPLALHWEGQRGKGALFKNIIILMPSFFI